MKLYYYDDDCEEDHWTKTRLLSDEDAIKWAEGLKAAFNPHNCIVYTENFKVIKEWRKNNEA